MSEPVIGMDMASGPDRGVVAMSQEAYAALVQRAEEAEADLRLLRDAARWFDNAGATAVHGGPDHDEGCVPCEAILALRDAMRRTDKYFKEPR